MLSGKPHAFGKGMVINMDKAEKMNSFLVNVFNEVLKTEESNIQKYGDLSLREIHVIEAVCNAEQGDNCATAIAENLRVTAGTLTTAVSVLEKKGYLIRNKDAKDKRVVRILATEKGREAKIHHDEFHRHMVDDILQTLTEEEATVFVRALESIGVFFAAKAGRENSQKA